jgi:hypothetical protein
MNATIKKLMEYGLSNEQAQLLVNRYSLDIVHEALDSDWEPTHIIEVDGYPTEFVMAPSDGDGPAFNPSEWVLDDNADWEISNGEWRFQGDVAPVANATVTITEVNR